MFNSILIVYCAMFYKRYFLSEGSIYNIWHNNIITVVLTILKTKERLFSVCKQKRYYLKGCLYDVLEYMNRYLPNGNVLFRFSRIHYKRCGDYSGYNSSLILIKGCRISVRADTTYVVSLVAYVVGVL